METIFRCNSTTMLAYLKVDLCRQPTLRLPKSLGLRKYTTDLAIWTQSPLPLPKDKFKKKTTKNQCQITAAPDNIVLGIGIPVTFSCQWNTRKQAHFLYKFLVFRNNDIGTGLVTAIKGTINNINTVVLRIERAAVFFQVVAPIKSITNRGYFCWSTLSTTIGSSSFEAGAGGLLITFPLYLEPTTYGFWYEFIFLQWNCFY